MHPELEAIDVSNPAHLRDIREHSLINRINATRVHLAALCAKGNYSDVGVFQFLSQAMLMLREGFVFAVGISAAGECAITNMTVHDEVLFPLFADAISEITADNVRPSLPSYTTDTDLQQRYDALKLPLDPEKSKPYRVRIFGTRYFVIAISVNDSQEIGQPRRSPNARYELCRVDSEMGKFLTILLYNFDTPIRSTGMKSYITDKIRTANTLPRVARLIDPKELRPPDRNDQDVISQAKKEIRDLIERDFSDSLPSPILSPRRRVPSNILFNAKVFDRANMRFQAYAFNNWLVLTQSQNNQFEKALALLQGFKTDEQYWYDNRYKADHARKPRFPYESTDKAFWEMIRDDNLTPLLTGIQEELGDNTRLATDHVLRSGAPSILVDPFHRGNIGRVAQRDRGPKSTPFKYPDEYYRQISRRRSFEQLRLATLHYLALLMVPGAASHSMLSFPLVVNGATWMTVTVTRPDLSPRGIFTTQDQWQLDRIFYDRIFGPMERHIRRRSRIAYLRLIAETVYQQVYHCENQLDRGDIDEISLSDTDLNDNLKRLTRVFPYDEIQFYRYENPPEFQSRYELHRVSNDRPYYFTIDKNKFYDQATVQHFIRPTEVADAVNPRLASL